ncbi:MAG: bifunctional diaminohydroxyphosphoribosylaminopyrimidine deaminase/5-amino-6-(5-phosphoribosylamino)uracil reductase RibD [Planctomycetota bacterium]
MSGTGTARGRARSRDARFMRRCLELAARAEGRSSPNPMVGAVVVRGGRVVAQAFHRYAGGPHAEALALRRVGAAARGATLYVNLEPCSHFGRTPPCADAIARAGLRRVVAAHRDPYPRVRGRGFAALRRAGLDVDVGVLRGEAMRLNAKYLTFVSRRRPYVLVKVAMTVDGRIATAGGESRWISSPRSRRLAQRLRASYDAIMVGINTVLADDPLLTARGGGRAARGGGRAARRRQPVRVVLDSRLRMGPEARLLRRGAGGPVIVYTTRLVPAARARRLEQRGARVVRLSASRSGPRGRVDLRAALRDLARRGITSVLIEGGGEVIGSALEAGVVDRVAFFMAPLILGDRRAVASVGGRDAAVLREAIRLSRLSVRTIGPDLLLEATPGRRRR